MSLKQLSIGDRFSRKAVVLFNYWLRAHQLAPNLEEFGGAFSGGTKMAACEPNLCTVNRLA